MGRQQQTFYPFQGGLDLETPAISMPPGKIIAVMNYEGAANGYRRIDGFERFDGQQSPSRVTFYIADFEQGETELVEGDIVEGATSGATGIVIGTSLEDGSWATDDASGKLGLHTVAGEFEAGEDLEVSAAVVAVLAGELLAGDRHSSDSEMLFWQTLTENTRAEIEEVPGSGPVRGVVWIDDALFAFRDNVGGTAGTVWRATPAGWSQISLGSLLKFDASTDRFTAGETITGGTSGATAVVREAARYSDTEWDLGASGVLVLGSVVGTFQNNEIITGGTSGATAAVDGTISAAALPPGGRYRFVRENFYGSTGTERVYGVNGVGPAFDFDGENIVLIPSGMEDDRPFLIAAHKKHLFLGFPKGSLQHSGLGEPRIFSAIIGAEEIGMGQELTNLVPNSADTLLVTTDRSIAILSGTSIADFALQTLSQETGARQDSAAWIGDVLYQDERGIRSVTTSQRYGNFTVGTYTQLISKELRRKNRLEISVVDAFALKAKDAYWLFFEDGTALTLYIGRKKPEPFLLGYPFVPSCFWIEEIAGEERVFAGTDDGWVYELNVGPSFDGEDLEAFVQFPFAHQGGPRVMKRYHKAMLELEAPPSSTLSIISQFDYGAGLQPFAGEDVFSILSGGGGSWGVVNWGEFYWDSPVVAQAYAHLEGMGANMALTIASSSAIMDSHTLQGVTLAFSVRGQLR